MHSISGFSKISPRKDGSCVEKAQSNENLMIEMTLNKLKSENNRLETSNVHSGLLLLQYLELIYKISNLYKITLSRFQLTKSSSCKTIWNRTFVTRARPIYRSVDIYRPISEPSRYIVSAIYHR